MSGVPVKRAGTWKSVAGSTETTTEFTWDKASKTYKGTITSSSGQQREFDKIEIAGKTITLENKFDYNGKVYTIAVTAEETDSGKLSGTYKALEDAGKQVLDGNWKSELEKAGDLPTDKDVVGKEPVKTKLVLKARHSDGFFAHLNGTEVLRINVASGNGISVKGGTAHNASEEIEYEIDSLSTTWWKS